MKVVLKEGYYVKSDQQETNYIFKEEDRSFVAWWEDESLAISHKAAGKGLIASYNYGGAFSRAPIETYFQDWTHPTEQEAEMFYMLFGVEIPWKSIELEVE